ncbi:MAG: tetratricopeptide repeat protein [Spirochaetaceae bacterium]|nr:MAG: tetratricopeptide repeat protein [Spirochaetaceae bacterium]
MPGQEYGVCKPLSNRPYAAHRARRCGPGVLLLCLLLVSASVGASPLLQRGEELYMQNRPAEAAAVLEAALEQQPRNERIYLYLGIVYEQLGRYERAAEILRRGLEVASTHRGLIYFNLGNNYLAAGNPDLADEMYTEAIRTDGSLAEAYLNRANLRVRTEQYSRAIDDYTVYLTLAPSTPQRDEIQRMISLLRDIIEQERVRREDEQRIAREEAERQRIAEERRREEERRAREEEEQRRRALLDSVLESLGGSRGEARSLGGGAEDIDDYEDVFDIAD